MKTTLVRAFVFSLAIAGLSASAVAAHSNHASTQVMAKGGVGSLPTPACGPNDPNYCGIQ